MSEGDSLILRKNTTKIHFNDKMTNNGGKEFLLATKFYKSSNDDSILAPDNWKPEGKADAQLEGMSFWNYQSQGNPETG